MDNREYNEAIKPYYHTPIDIAYYFRDRESTKELLTHIVNEAHKFADAIDKKGNQIPYPIVINDIGNYADFQIDYQFMVHAIADFVSIKTQDNSSYTKVLRAFAFLRGNISKKINDSGYSSRTRQDFNRQYLTFLMETMSNITALTNYNKILSKNAVCFDKFVSFQGSKYFMFKAVTFAKKRQENQGELGLERYLDEEIVKTLERFFHAYRHHKMEQIGFKKKEIDAFCEENNVKKNIYFFIEEDKLNEKIDYDERAEFRE